MSMADCKARLIEMIADYDNKVIVLAGKWGTGKTFLWHEIQKEAEELEETDVTPVKKALKVSIFGAQSLADLRLRFAQSVVNDSKSPLISTILEKAESVKKMATTLYKGVGVIDEIFQMTIPTIVKNKFIVIDDIERKHKNLAIEEVLGMIDHFVHSYGCRFLLILNTGKLDDGDSWDTLREKLIDQELTLATTPAEAFDIAKKMAGTSYGDHIKKAIEICNVTNIRVAYRVIKLVNLVLKSKPNLSDKVLQRLIPSTVLIGAAHYRGVENAPPMDYIKRAGEQGMKLKLLESLGTEANETPEDAANKAKWDLLLNNLGIHYADEFETMIVNALQSGNLDPVGIAGIADKYCSEEENQMVSDKVRELFLHIQWYPDDPEGDLLQAAEELLASTGDMHAQTVTALHNELVTLPKGHDLAARFIAKWIADMKAHAEVDSKYPKKILSNIGLLKQQIHPDIATALIETEAKMTVIPSLVEVCLKLATNEGLSSAEEFVMSQTDVDAYEEAILSLRGEDLQKFMLKNKQLFISRDSEVARFGSAPQYFGCACKRILDNPRTPRWRKIMETLFSDGSLDALKPFTIPVQILDEAEEKKE